TTMHNSRLLLHLFDTSTEPGSSVVGLDSLNYAELLTTDARNLASLMDLGRASKADWRPDEMALIFKHQLSALMAADLERLTPSLVVKLKYARGTDPHLFLTFGDLFRHEATPTSLLALVAEFAKANSDNPESPIPFEIAHVL